jgi:CBS domain-containing protein
MIVRTEQLMNRPVITCNVRETLNLAARLLWENDCGALPVVDDGGALVGMLTDRDICMAAYTSGRLLTQLCAQEAMARNIHTCRASDDLAAVERIMAEAQVHRLPVLDADGALLGIITSNDLVRAVSHDSKPGAADTLTTLNTLNRLNTLNMLAAVAAPRHAQTLLRAA